MTELWIVIPNWQRFQHYTDRDPIWIKDYVSQLHDDAWSSLSFAERGVLQTCRLLYAASDGKVTKTELIRLFSYRGAHLSSLLDSLNDAGLIELRASKPLALARSREKRSVEKKEAPLAEPEDRQSFNGEPEPIAGVLEREANLRLYAYPWLDATDPKRPEPEPDPEWHATPEEPF